MQSLLAITFLLQFLSAKYLIIHVKCNCRSLHLFCRKIELWNEIFDSQILLCEELLLMHDRNDKKCLYMPDQHWTTLEELSQNIHMHAFFGTALSYNSYKSIRICNNFLMNSFISYSKFHRSSSNVIFKVLKFPVNFGNHLFRPERRGRKFVKASKTFDVSLCKVNGIEFNLFF
jgi:Hormone-sensitive lipase (HSL) N-terminus